MSEESKEFNADVVSLLRAVMKISSALNNLDSLQHDKKYIKFDLKKEINDWHIAVQGTTDTLMKSLVQENDGLFMEIYNSLDELDSRIHMSNEKKRELIIFYIKLKSALNDLSKMESKNWMDHIIRHYTKVVVSRIELMYKPIINIVDNDGVSVLDFVKFYDETGDKIMHTGDIEPTKTD
jgi:hypothetical protein